MGFKSRQSNNRNKFKIGGLIFDSEEDYLVFENIDKNMFKIVDLVDDSIILLNEVFNNVKTIHVKERYYNSREEIYDLFKIAGYLLTLKNTVFNNDYEVGRCFFDKIIFLKY